MENRNIVISLLFLLTAFVYEPSVAQMPAGMEPDFKPTSYKFGDWRLKKGDTLNSADSSLMVVKSLEIYKISGWEKLYLRLQSSKGEVIEGELVSLLRAGTILSPVFVELPDESVSDEDRKTMLDIDDKGYYEASNGVKYKVGDWVEMGFGSAPNGGYHFMTMGGFWGVMRFNAYGSANQLDAVKGFQGYKLQIIKMKTIHFMGQSKVCFVVKAPLSRYNLLIEDAIGKCEVLPCKSNQQVIQQLSAADEILKYKKLMDDGIITKEEFEAKKQQLLSK